MAMEAKYSKEEILTIYFNRAYLGAGARGFEAAAQRYFGKSANEVNAAESAMLAGLLKAPSYFAPTNNMDRARARANVIIGLMEEQGFVTTAQADEARARPAELSEAAATRSGGFFADWVMETALRQQARWRLDPAMAHLSLAINVSARQFLQEDFVTQVLALLQRTGADPAHIKLELTESLLLDNVDSVIATMRALKAQGLGFSLDDFGTGYSSLSYLKRLPLDQIKIDQGFVRDVLLDPSDAAIARSIIALAGSLGLDVIAEGVETAAHHQFLLAHGCKAFQGYLFGRPMALEDFERVAREVLGPEGTSG